MLKNLKAGGIRTGALACAGCLFCLLGNLAWGEVAEQPSQALTPDAAISSFKTADGIKVELVAAEPLVADPVALAFDAHGRLFVAENRGYPTGPAAGEAPLGRIALLEDTNSDGQWDRRSEFADDLTFPNGLLPWNGGLIVTCAPDIIYLKDTNGDGRADVREVWLTGFAITGSTQLRVSHPTLGVDGWIYVTSGLTGGEVTCPSQPQKDPVKFGRQDFRFRPDLSAYEPCDGGGQFGLAFDEAGRRFVCDNRVQVQHVVVPSRYFQRNPHLAFAETIQKCPAEYTIEPVKGHGVAARIFPISRNVTTADSHAGSFTAACGLSVYRGDGLPAAFRHAAISCDPTGNLVHGDQLTPQGASFDARQMFADHELLASTDDWFRPVFTAHGPDGALYVCDMYRRVIEHPDYLPEEIRKHTDFESGKGLGRIWRLTAATPSPAATENPAPKQLADLSNDKLVALLSHPNGWTCDTAFRLLLERGDAEVGRQLAKQLPQVDWPTAALVRGLWLVERLVPPDELATTLPPLLDWALSHPQAEVAEQALQLLPENQIADHAAKLIALATTGGNRVQLLAMLQLGAVPSAQATAALAQAAHQLSHDRWFRAAAMAGIANRELEFLAALVHSASQDRSQISDRADLAGLLYFEVGQLLGRASSKDAWQPTWCRAITTADALPIASRASLLMGMRQSLVARGLVASQKLREIAPIAYEADQTYQASIERLIAECHRAAMATDQEQSASQPWCVLALGACRDPESTKLLLSLATGSYPLTARLAAVQALSELPDASVAQTLLSADHFTTYSPSLRETVLSALLSQKSHLPGVLAAVAAGDVPAAAIDSLRRRQLTEHGDEAIREQARQLFSPASSGERAQVFQQLREVLQLTPQAENGRVIFRKACANCHRLDREGVAVGPDLFGIRNQPKETLLLHIIVPEHEIAPQYVAYSVQTSDGRVLNGLLAAESANSITLRQALGKEETVLRDDIDQMQASTLSLMPQELEKQMTKQELCDLLAYLKGEASAE